MLSSDFYEYFQNLPSLEQEEIVSTLHGLLVDTCSKIESIRSLSCPHCTSDKIRGNGKNKGVQRYVCQNCSKNFSETTGKLLYNLKKPSLLRQYLPLMLRGISIQKSAKELGISVQTSFDWRHKILSAFQETRVKEFSGILESDDFFLLESKKGQKVTVRKARKRGEKASQRGVSNQQRAVIASCDRKGNLDFHRTKKGRIGKEDLEKALQGKVGKVEILCSDAHHSYTAFGKSQTLQHKKLNQSKGQRVKDRVYHLQNVNNQIKRLKQWIQRFNGVSDQYLQNYLNWFMVLEKIKNSTKKIKELAVLALLAENTIQNWKMLSQTYLN